MRRTRALEEQVLKRPRIDELGCEVEVRRHPGARRLTLRVSRTRRAVIVTLPVQCDLGEAGTFLNRNLEWVRERLDSLPRPVPFSDGALMPLRGDFHRLVFSGRRNAGGVVQRRSTSTGVPELHVSGRNEHAARRLRDWLFEEARRDLDTRVVHHARRLGVAPKRIVVRDQAIPLGLVLDDGRALVLLAAYSRAGAHPRLRRRARGRAPQGNEPRPALLGPRRAHRAGDERSQELAAALRSRFAPVRAGRARLNAGPCTNPRIARATCGRPAAAATLPRQSPRGRAARPAARGR